MNTMGDKILDSALSKVGVHKVCSVLDVRQKGFD